MIGETPQMNERKPSILRRILRVLQIDSFSALFHTRLDKSGSRLKLIAFAFVGLYCVIIGKMVHIGLKPDMQQSLKHAAAEAVAAARPDILDRHGEILATDVRVMSVFAEPRRIIDKDEAVELLTAALPDVDADELRKRIDSKKGFIWVKRGVTPKEQRDVFRLGLPGVGFIPENKRVYPNGPVAAHILGHVDPDGHAMGGLETYIDRQGLSDLHGAGFDLAPENLAPITTSIDLKATYALREQLRWGMDRYHAKAAGGAIMDVNTGEVIALVSLPDFDPNNGADALSPDKINRMTVGTYEMGSTFKAVTWAMGLESGLFNLNSSLDARQSLPVAGHLIHDFREPPVIFSYVQAFARSSNIGAARIAMRVGVDGHKAFLSKLGLFGRMVTELPENAMPQVQKNWSILTTATVAFGQGIAEPPLQAAMAVMAMTNGGYLITPTFLRRSEQDARASAPQVVSAKTSEEMRYLFRNDAIVGTASKVNVPGYCVGGKTGTAQKVIGHSYSNDKVLTTFTALVPADKPKYLYLVIFDEPQALPGDGGYHTAGYNAAIVTANAIKEISPLLNMPPRLDLPDLPGNAAGLVKCDMDPADVTGSIKSR
ncbi:peptidoglycan D,D-transpeptidase FtsI family protein [Methylovirgula sp. 4M-Z18]|uniref:peptidoglycan D,D-transpeptidase FtsI family protein n=1 Tax=Methylovirgula sp. 4M-Z18 TaxID=2293567 RepID=UPI000E2EB059|nr:penicillin-binding protein 2 [Methylovirgula sp. 4M-Z18]RFB79616.1 penicillin-binding protein 2 [Methylovirgula sp. 4M-Z18]